MSMTPTSNHASLFFRSYGPLSGSFPDLHPPSIYHSSLPINLDRQLSWFDFLIPVNTEKINMNEPVSLWCDLESSGYVDGMILDAD